MKLSNLDYQMFLNQKLPIQVIDSEEGIIIATTAKDLQSWIESETKLYISATFKSAVEFQLYSNDGLNTVYCNVNYDNSTIAQFMAYSFLQANSEAIFLNLHESIEPILMQTIAHFEKKEIEEAEIQYLSDIKNGDYPN